MNTDEQIERLSKREYFAALAMQGLLATNDPRGWDYYAVAAVKLSDALIAELSKRDTQCGAV